MRSKITSVSLYWIRIRIRIRIRKSIRIRIRIRISIRMYPVLCRLNPDSVKKSSGFDRIRKKQITYIYGMWKFVHTYVAF